MSGPAGIRVEHRDRIAIISIDRPERRNAVDAATAKEISAALDELDDHDDLRVGVITGRGGSFCAGMDLKAVAETGERPIDPKRGPFGLCEMPPEKPLIAAVEGAALGGGCEIALACDLIVATKEASFGLPEVKRGLVAGAGGVLRLPRRLPHGLALELALTGEPLSAERAAKFGMVNRLAADGKALEAATELAAAIAVNAPLAVRASKWVIKSSVTWPEEEMFERQHEKVQMVRESADAAEGVRAFVEKRPPQWQGK
jgi:enoyl-CoA hydratase/carnithine racemase